MFRWPENVLSIVASTLDNEVHLTELCISSWDSGNSQKTLSGIPSCRNSVIKLRWWAAFDIFQCSRMEARMEISCSYWILKIPISQLWHLCLCNRIMAFTFCPGLSCFGVRVNPCVGLGQQILELFDCWTSCSWQPSSRRPGNRYRQLCAPHPRPRYNQQGQLVP